MWQIGNCICINGAFVSQVELLYCLFLKSHNLVHHSAIVVSFLDPVELCLNQLCLIGSPLPHLLQSSEEESSVISPLAERERHQVAMFSTMCHLRESNFHDSIFAVTALSQ